jgi:polygalacturonase/pectin methylesterase-like acyl-CoA thioesterase
LSRPAQTGTNNTVQDVLIDSQSTSVGYSTPAGVGASGAGTTSTTFTNGATYTLNYRVALSADGATLTATLSIYNGTGTTGTGANTLIGSYSGRFTGANLLTTSFDALAIGWRADAGTSNPSNLKLSSLAVNTTGGTPWFTTQPPSAVAVSIGSSLNLNAVVGGLVTGYQWQVSTNGGASYTNLDATANPSAATASLTVSNAQTSDAGLYRLVATNAAGSSASTPTSVAVSSTDVAPTITTNPASATVLGGTSYTFGVTVNGTSPLSYQWYFSADGASFSPIAGATGATLPITAVSLSNEGYYRVTITNVAGSATSTTAQLTVNQPLTITGQPTGAALNLGDSFTLFVTAVGKPAPTYQWYLNGASLAGATGATYTIASAAAANAGLYTVVVSNSAGDQVTSSAASVAVISPSLSPAAQVPALNATSIIPDTRLTLTFNQPVAVGLSGTIRIYDTANPTTPVDTIDLTAANALMKTLRAGSTISTQLLPVQNKTVGGLTNFNYYPITVSGSTVTIYPRNNVLGYGKTYFVTIDAGVFVDSSGLSFAGISSPTGWRFSTKTAGPLSTATTLVVAADGSGDFNTVQAALDWVPAANTTPRTIYIRKGTYFEQVYFNAKHSLTILGEDRAQSVIIYPNNNTFNNVSGSYHRMVFQADRANNLVVANLTVKNSTPKGGSQAEALILNGTTTAQAIVTNVDLFSYQDTLQINGQGYVASSHISGDVDFMWGSGPCFFTGCEITALTSNAYYTQIRNGSAGHGYVYYRCTLNGATGVSGMNLARIDPAVSGGFPYSEVVWLDCVMGTATGSTYSTPVGAAGWLLNNTPDQTAASAPNVHFWEYNSHYSDGTPLNVASRIGASRQLTLANDATTISNYSTPSYVLNGWTPQLAPIVASQPVGQTLDAGAGFTLSASAVSIPAPTYQWQRNGVAIPGATNSTYTVATSTSADAGTYTVVIGNGSTSVTSTAASLVIHGGPPVLVVQPATTSALLGTTATLNTWAVGDGPFAFQWSRDGTPIAGATRQALRLTGLQAGDGGAYTVAVTNANGTTVSSVATLTIDTPVTTLPTQPVIPNALFDVTTYGAVGDGATDSTAAIQATINAAVAAGGGTVEFPPAAGAYLSGPITLSSNLNVQLDAGATLRALPFGTYPKSTTSPSHFITIASGSSNVEFSGGGAIDGDGAAWWTAFDAGTITGRPRLVQINKSSNMLFSGIRVLNSPNFNLAFSGANTNVTIYGVTITAPGDSPNTDGMDLAGTNYLVQNCAVSVGDDNIVAKPGSVFCRNIVIANCRLGEGHGVSVGGQTNVGLDGMLVTNCTFNGTSTGLRLKADATQGGPVQNVTFSNITMTNVTYPILFYSYYNQIGSPGATSGSSQTTGAKVNSWNATPPNSLAASTIPTWKNITVSNLTATGSTGYSTIWGLPLADALVANVTLNNVSISGAGLEIYDATNVQLTGNSTVTKVLTTNGLGITKQPQPATVSVGGSATFTATAVGGSGTIATAITYQWNLNGVALSDGAQADGTVVSGATTATLSVSNLRATSAGNYTLTASTLLDGYNVASGSLVAASLPVSATSAPGVLTVNALPATVAVSNLTYTYDGTPKAPTVTTGPAGVAVNVVYAGGATPVNAGTYGFTVTIADPNYTAAPVTGTLTIGQATPTVTWTQPAALTYGTALGGAQLNATASTAGTFAYTPAAGTVLNAGADQPLAVVFTPADAVNYTSATAATTIAVNPAPVSFALTNLTQTYDGSARPVTVTITPAGVAFAVTYNGAAAAPVNAGSYAVNAVVTDANYTGAASGTLVIMKATPAISWPQPAAITYGTALSGTQLCATASVAGTFGYTPASGTVLQAGTNQILSATFSPTDKANYNDAYATQFINVNKAPAVITFTGLTQPYGGTAKTVTTATVPADLKVLVTYAGSSMGPVFPGRYPVLATIDDPNYAGTTTQTLAITITALVRHAPTLSGAIDGSLQMLSGENVTLNGNAWISGDLLVPGTPSLRLNGMPMVAGTTDEEGSVSPANYAVTLNGRAVLRYLVRRIDPLSLPTVAVPTQPTGTRSVTLNSASDSAGDFATLRTLTLNGNAGTVTVPAGAYGQIVANGNTTLVLGHAGALRPDVYQVQTLTLNGNSRVQLAGPVLLVLANGLAVNGTVNDAAHAEWLTVAIASGGLTLNGNAAFGGFVVAPSGTVTINSGAILTGEVISDGLAINADGQLNEPAN